MMQYAQFALSFVLAISVSYIAYQQWITARSKVLLDLFDRRLALYQSIETAIRESAKNYKNGGTEMLSSTKSVLSASYASIRFLFGAEIELEIKTVYDRLNEIESCFESMMNGSVGDELKTNMEEKIENENAIDQYLYDMPDRFDPYINLSYLKHPAKNVTIS